MGRKVYITSDMCIDEKLIDLAEHNSEVVLLWPWLLMAFDDWGRAEANPKRLKAKLFPMFSVTVELIDTALRLFHDAGLLQLYSDGNKQYMAIEKNKWFKYQTHIRRSKREKDDSRIPAPPNDDVDKRAQMREGARICIPSPSPSPSPSKDQKIFLANCGLTEGSEDKPQKDENTFDFPDEYWEMVDTVDDIPEDQQLSQLVKQYNQKYPEQYKQYGAAGSVKARKVFAEALKQGILASQVLKEILFDMPDEEPKPWDITDGLINSKGLLQTRAQMHYEMARQLEREVSYYGQRDPPEHRRGDSITGNDIVSSGHSP